MRKLLIFQHQFREHASRFNQYALENNIELTVVRLWEPYEMPHVSSFDALVVLGGSMNVGDDFPSKEDELAVIAKNVGKLPMLGICLGGQLIAHALGAPVKQMVVDGKRDRHIGFETVTLTPDGAQSPLFKGFPPEFVVTQIHGDTFDIPKGAQHLAESALCSNQAFSYGDKTFGIQFHLEHTPYTLAHLFENNKKWIPDYAKGGEKRLMDEAFKTQSAIQKHFELLIGNFLSL